MPKPSPTGPYWRSYGSYYLAFVPRHYGYSGLTLPRYPDWYGVAEKSSHGLVVGAVQMPRPVNGALIGNPLYFNLLKTNSRPNFVSKTLYRKRQRRRGRRSSPRPGAPDILHANGLGTLDEYRFRASHFRRRRALLGGVAGLFRRGPLCRFVLRDRRAVVLSPPPMHAARRRAVYLTTPDRTDQKG